jgi:hypothetical protein
MLLFLLLTATAAPPPATPPCNVYDLAHAAASGRQFDTVSPGLLAAAGGLGGGGSSAPRGVAR